MSASPKKKDHNPHVQTNASAPNPHPPTQPLHESPFQSPTSPSQNEAQSIKTGDKDITTMTSPDITTPSPSSEDSNSSQESEESEEDKEERTRITVKITREKSRKRKRTKTTTKITRKRIQKIQKN